MRFSALKHEFDLTESERQDLLAVRSTIPNKLGEHMSLFAFTRRETVYLDGTRYFSHEGYARQLPRGRTNKFYTDSDGFIFEKHFGETTVVGFDEEVYGMRDLWWTQPVARAKAPSAMTPYRNVLETTASEWFRRNTSQHLIFNGMVITSAIGSEGGGRGRRETPASVRVRSESGLNFIEIEPTNRSIDFRLRSVTESTDATRVIDGGPLYKPEALLLDSKLWAVSENLIFTEREDVEELFRQGLTGTIELEPVDASSLSLALDAIALFVEQHFPTTAERRLAAVRAYATDHDHQLPGM